MPDRHLCTFADLRRGGVQGSDRPGCWSGSLPLYLYYENKRLFAQFLFTALGACPRLPLSSVFFPFVLGVQGTKVPGYPCDFNVIDLCGHHFQGLQRYQGGAKWNV